MVLLDDPIVQGGTLMHHRIDIILKRLRQDVARQLDPESILSAWRTAGHSWRKSGLSGYKSKSGNWL
jgi:predicted NBD/HSP70 family sugar kinase